MATPGNPLLGSWPSTAGTNQPPPALPTGPTGNTGTTNPYGFGTKDGGALASNLAETNLQSGVYKNKLMPLFSQMMMSAGGDASKFFKMLTDAGSPFYQRKQQQTAEQGAKAGNEQAGMARERLAASGQGSGPSGAGAAMFGGMGQAEAGNQEEAFLNNLFQNEQLQLAGAQGLTSIAGLFNPSQLTGQGTSTSIEQAQNTAAQMMSGIGQMAGGLFGSGGIKGAIPPP
jgi:hypothetical protein